MTALTGATDLAARVGDMIRDGGYTKPLKVRTVTFADGTVRVTITPPGTTALSHRVVTVLTQIIEASFKVGDEPPRISVVEYHRIVFRWYR